MKKLQDKVAVITGGTTGIGQAAARLFHAEGANLMLVDIDEAPLAASPPTKEKANCSLEPGGVVATT